MIQPAMLFSIYNTLIFNMQISLLQNMSIRLHYIGVYQHNESYYVILQIYDKFDPLYYSQNYCQM